MKLTAESIAAINDFARTRITEVEEHLDRLQEQQAKIEARVAGLERSAARAMTHSGRVDRSRRQGAAKPHNHDMAMRRNSSHRPQQAKARRRKGIRKLSQPALCTGQ